MTKDKRAIKVPKVLLVMTGTKVNLELLEQQDHRVLKALLVLKEIKVMLGLKDQQVAMAQQVKKDKKERLVLLDQVDHKDHRVLKVM